MSQPAETTKIMKSFWTYERVLKDPRIRELMFQAIDASLGIFPPKRRAVALIRGSVSGDWYYRTWYSTNTDYSELLCLPSRFEIINAPEPEPGITVTIPRQPGDIRNWWKHQRLKELEVTRGV